MNHKNSFQPRITSSNQATLSEDGYVRMPIALFREIPIEHLISGLDMAEPAYVDRQSSVTDISGYTEWISEIQPIITIGWDWWLDFSKKPPACLRVGVPRSNIMLLDPQNNDLGYDRTANALGLTIDNFAWQGKTLEAIGFQNP